MIDVTIKGEKELTRRLNAIADHSARRGVIRKGLNAGATVMIKEARRNTPKGPTGNLKKSWKKSRVMRDDGLPAIIVHNVAPHAHLVEFGTVYRFHKSGKAVGMMYYNPFFRKTLNTVTEPAFEAMRKKLREILIDKAV